MPENAEGSTGGTPGGSDDGDALEGSAVGDIHGGTDDDISPGSDGGGGRNRREFLARAGGVALGTGLASALAERGVAHPVRPKTVSKSASRGRASADTGEVFPQSVASGDPSTTGVILWTRIAPDAYREDADLRVEVATDATFDDIVHRGVIDASDIEPAHDFTVQVDLDGHLAPGEEYAYRFWYTGVSSQHGRCQTLPAADARPERLQFAVMTCQDYTNGYYPAYHYVAESDVDFLVHLGDFIYEAVDGRFKGPGSRKYEGRDISLPSGSPVARDLADFRALHRTYRSDRFLQRALARHTLIAGWDDHEVVNNRYWDYEEDVPRAPGREGDLTQLTADGITAWVEYIPSRVGYDPANPDDPDLQAAFDLGRTFRFGELLELVLTDERLFRSEQPCRGATQVGPACEDPDDADHTPETDEPDTPAERHTMLGTEQRKWFLDEVTTSTATWTAWANEVLTMPFKAGEHEATVHPLGHDAWDGYQHERELVMERIGQARSSDGDLRNFVTLTGDMHTYLAGYQQIEYEDPTGDASTNPLAPEENRVGVEFMTPAVTSVNFAELHPGQSPPGEAELSETLAHGGNRHIQYLDSSRWGYSVVEFTPDECTYTAYAVDKTENSPDAERERLKVLRVPEGTVRIEEAVAVDNTVDVQNPGP